MADFIKKAITHPGVEKAKAKRNGVSTRQQLETDAKSTDPKVRARGELGLRFEAGGDLHRPKARGKLTGMAPK